MDVFDLVIVGAGWHGLSMAKTFTEVHPSAKVVIVDSAASIGGVWATERLYAGLKTNNLIGSYEFGDFPMSPSQYNLQPGQHIPGHVVHKYLEEFANHFDLRRRIRLERKVQSAELTAQNKWKLILHATNAEKLTSNDSTIIAERLVLATGLTSEPFIPNINGMHSFRGSIMHSREMKSRLPLIKPGSEVIVVGGNKSAWDACFSAASTGAHVHMILRPTGRGPSWVWPAAIPPFGVSVAQLAGTRFFTWFDPCVWGKSDPYSWIRHLLHKTWLGRCIASLFWKGLGYLAQKANGYDSHPELAKLRPWISPFWMGNSLSIHNYDSNWFSLVKKGNIQVHIADIESLTKDDVHLSTGITIQADALICCTGWQVAPPIKFLPEGIEQRFGFPGGTNINSDILQKARRQIYADIPSLRQRPDRKLPSSVPAHLYQNIKSDKQGSPYRLHRFLVPVDEDILELHNLAFMGFHLSLNATMVAQIQALWLTAFLGGKIKHLKPSNLNHNDVLFQTALHTEYCRIRHPQESGGAGERCPDLVFDSVSYVDLLLDDLGLQKQRKPHFWKEIFDRYFPSDFRGVVDEWLKKQS